ncbi:MAG: beta-ketoacyl synthase N-terminal-like domain-containing protein [Dehalococcoidia bacterium]|nr:beta-ketoacyl synthase N-terminal-like domain-containing protein [Dehalococcoidia bacterium]
MSETRIVVTGRGVRSPLGCDWPSFSQAVRDGHAAPVAPFPNGGGSDSVLCHLLSEPLEPDGARPAQRGEPLAALATATVRDALADARGAHGDRPLDDVGLVMNTVFGPSTAVEAYLERLRERGPRAARPALFVDTLLSMPASRVGIALGLRGSTAVLGGSSALELAFDWLRAGRDHTVVAGGAEYQSPKCLRYYDALAARSGAERPRLAQAGAFLVLDTSSRAETRGARPYAELLGAGAASEPQEVALPWSADPEGRAQAAAMRGALADAGIEPGAVQSVALAAGDDASEAGELAALHAVFGARAGSLRILRPKRLAGEALGASASLSVLMTLADRHGADERAITVVNAFEMGGAASSVVVRPMAP